MKTRTTFKLLGKGLVYCWSGCLRDFVEDINEFILPILEDNIKAEFNGKQITIYAHDDTDKIYTRFWNTFRD